MVAGGAGGKGGSGSAARRPGGASAAGGAAVADGRQRRHDGHRRDGRSAGAAVGPCDIYKSGGNPCVAAHSTVRALFGAYSGKLYQVRNAAGHDQGHPDA